MEVDVRRRKFDVFPAQGAFNAHRRGTLVCRRYKQSNISGEIARKIIASGR